ncbi:hypothetical protein BOX15_Mlig012151g2 [Macrostomum lignano]|uniref:Phospholipid scramblase n=1 Tax=Macrostomum lignano TaxID=282301 RepID=A0A267DPR1_9PLAT|nr:hypothetical protein BOX15_Mlig012151g3 [Macrostomum lignano]PAA51751.1 hypothetical protein BOX15_Mlig012151g2 [Macrostomum lignano]
MPLGTAQLSDRTNDDAKLDEFLNQSAAPNATTRFLDEEEEEEDVYDEDDTCSEVAGQCGSKPYLDRFAFVTHAEVHPVAYCEYEVTGDAGLPFLRAMVQRRSTGCCGGSTNQGFNLFISDISSKQTVVKLTCDQHWAVTVESPPTEVIGYVSVERVLCSLRFTIKDIHGTARILVRMPKYCQASCKRHRFRVLLPDESEEVASITRRLITAVEIDEKGPVYTLQVGEMMSTDMKAMLIGVMLMFDRKLFDSH